MKTFFQDGTSKEEFYFLGEQPFLYIQELDGNMPDRFVYQGDSIKYKLDNELVALYDKLRDLFFPNTEQYYAELSLMPIFVQSAGQDSECALSAEQFRQYLQIEKFQNIPNFYRHLYLVDCQYYVGTIQNLLIGMEDAFINYYLRITLVRPDATPDNPNDALSIISPEVISISGLIENYFIKAYSILDMLCKIALEMEQPQNSLMNYSLCLLLSLILPRHFLISVLLFEISWRFYFSHKILLLMQMYYSIRQTRQSIGKN